MIINNGDIFDIGQTINGVSTFIYLNEKIYYFYDDEIQREYEYDIKEIYYTITTDYDGDVKFIREEKLNDLRI